MRAFIISMLAVLSASVVTLSSCLNVAEDRAAREARVGQAELDGVSVQVKNGLAAIRALRVEGETAELWLWAQAPTLEVTVSLSAGAPVKTLELKLSNVMRESVISQSLSRSTAQSSEREINSPSPLDSPSTLDVPLTFETPTVARTTISLDERVSTLNLTPPTPTPGEPWRFALFADVQERIDGLSELLIPLGREPEVRFALISGDLTQRGSVEALTTFQEQMESHLPFPCYATLGNHELGTSGVPFYDLFGRGSFSFTYGDVRFSLLDGASATIAPSARRLLSKWLDLGQEQLHVFATHIPLIDPDGTRGGAFASRLESAALLDELRSHHVDLLLYGHVHTYRRFSQAGIPAIISGGGGSIPMRLDGIGRHYVIFEVDRVRSGITHRVAEISPAE